MKDKVNRRDFIKSMMALGIASVASNPINSFAQDNAEPCPYFTNSFEVKELYSNAMVFRDKKTETFADKDAELSYFVRDKNEDGKIDEVYSNFTIRGEEKDREEYHLKIKGEIKDGNYEVKDVQVVGRIFDDPGKQYEFDDLVATDLRNVLKKDIENNLESFNNSLEALVKKEDNLKTAPRDYDPFPTRYEEWQNTMDGVDDIISPSYNNRSPYFKNREKERKLE